MNGDVITVQFYTVIQKELGYMTCWTSSRGSIRGSFPTGFQPLRINFYAALVIGTH